MPGIARVGVDTAGGLITGSLAPSVHVNGVPIVVVGAIIAPHSTGIHLTAHTLASSATVRAGGILVCRAGDAATCGDLCTGSGNVNAG